MSTNKKKLPIGIDDFAKLRQDDFYYVDKTGLIRDLLNNWGEVNLFTRPRRFGKSLNMSMLENFFSIEGNRHIFDGLEISKDSALCDAYMQQFPVISISMKGIHAASYETARNMAVLMINDAAAKVQYLSESSRLTALDKQMYAQLTQSSMSDAALFVSLRRLCELLEKHYQKKVILLIDEYDVPLAKAFENGYYDQMVFMIRSLFEQVLKTNSSLKFAVLTGCMRITKESIFTGLNNLRVLSVTDVEFDEYFGFTHTEVESLLQYYGLLDHFDTIQEWYDGYQFGNVSVYCPWDVICFCSKLRADAQAQPQNYWINTSSNDVVRKFIQHSDSTTTKREIERLIAGEVITKELHPELTYKDMYKSTDHICSLLFTTGYLTQRGRQEGDCFHLVIPNIEIRNIFTRQIMECFKEAAKKDGDLLNLFCSALQTGNAEKVEQLFTAYLQKTISIRDTFAQKPLKENFYHGILLGILGLKENWCISSNRETGDGYSDIVAETENMETGISIEVKYAHDGNLDAGGLAAIRQIERLHYEEELKDEGSQTIYKYGICCYKKRCKVMLLS